MNTQIVIGILIPFVGTSLGAAMVFILKNSVSKKLQRILIGFAAGVMVAASFWSLLQPALESSESMGKLSFVPAAVGFLIGIGFLLLLDVITPHMHMNQEGEGPKTSLKRTTKLILAVTLHNIPEGMAVGVVYANLIAGNSFISMAGALALAIGIAIQNFPEGAIVSMPLRAEGMSKAKTFLYGLSYRFPTLTHYVGCNFRSKEYLTSWYKTVIYSLPDLRFILISLSGVDMTKSCLKGKTNIVYCCFTT